MTKHSCGYPRYYFPPSAYVAPSYQSQYSIGSRRPAPPRPRYPQPGSDDAPQQTQWRRLQGICRESFTVSRRQYRPSPLGQYYIPPPSRVPTPPPPEDYPPWAMWPPQDWCPSPLWAPPSPTPESYPLRSVWPPLDWCPSRRLWEPPLSFDPPPHSHTPVRISHADFPGDYISAFDDSTDCAGDYFLSFEEEEEGAARPMLGES